MVEAIRVDNIFMTLSEMVIKEIPSTILPISKEKIIDAVKVLTPNVSKEVKEAFLETWKEGFSDEELGELLGYYGPGTPIWSFFESEDFLPWLEKIMKSLILINKVQMMSTEGCKDLVNKIDLIKILDLLPQSVSASITEYKNSTLFKKEIELSKRASERATEKLNKINWFNLLEEAGIID